MRTPEVTATPLAPMTPLVLDTRMTQSPATFLSSKTHIEVMLMSQIECSRYQNFDIPELNPKEIKTDLVSYLVFKKVCLM